MESKRVELEYQSFSEGNQWNLVYQGIGQRCQSYTYTFTEAKKTENKPLNRYRDVNPYDHSRIIIQREDFFTDYINANLVKMERANRQYILTQGPLVYTSGHFWLMVWEQNSPAIIMLNKIIEKSEIKCHWYWPHENGEGHKVVYPDVNMSITQIKEYDYSYYTIRKLKLTHEETNESRDIWHFHYTTWPDFEVPQSPYAFLNFLQRVRQYGALDCAGDKGPAIVHCSAGIGRSGTFCLVDSVLVLIEKEGQENVDIQEILLEMRRYRMGLIQTAEQLRFSYLAIVEGIKRLSPDYVPPETVNESVYSSVADDEEAPPPPPPRGESLGCPPRRPLPAIPTSVSMAELNLYARRRARPGFDGAPAFAETGGVPTLVYLARDAYLAIDLQPKQLMCAAGPAEDDDELEPRAEFNEATQAIAAAEDAAEAEAALKAKADAPNAIVPSLAFLSARKLISMSPNQHDQPLLVEQQLDLFYGVPNCPNFMKTEPEDDYLHTEGSDSISISDDPSLIIDTFVEASTDDSPLSDLLLGYLSSENDGQGTTSLSTTSESEVLCNIDVSANLESEDSDAPPTPPPRDRPRDQAVEPRRDTPSPASSAYADEELEDETTEATESLDTSAETTENADTVESAVQVTDATGDGVRKRRALAERVASMKKRSRDADQWHSFKRSLVKPLALSVGILAVGIFIYAYSKH